MRCNNPGKRELDWSRVNVWSASRTGDTFGLNVRWALKGLFLNGRTHNHSNNSNNRNNNKKKTMWKEAAANVSLYLSLAPCSHVYSFEYAVIRFFMALNVSLSRLFSGSFSFFSCGLSVRDTIGKKEIENPGRFCCSAQFTGSLLRSHFYRRRDEKTGEKKKREAPWKKKKEKCLYPFLLLSCCV